MNINIVNGAFREYIVKITIEENASKRSKIYEFMLEEIIENLIPVRTGRQFDSTPYSGINKYKLNIRHNS